MFQPQVLSPGPELHICCCLCGVCPRTGGILEGVGWSPIIVPPAGGDIAHELSLSTMIGRGEGYFFS